MRSPAAGGRLGRGGVRPDRDHRRAVGDLRLHDGRAAEDRLRRPPGRSRRLPTSTASVITPEPRRDRESAGDLLALRRGRHQHRRRATHRRPARPRPAPRPAARPRSPSKPPRRPADVDLRRAVLGEPVAAAVVAAGPDQHRGRLAEPAGQRQQLGGDLLDGRRRACSTRTRTSAMLHSFGAADAQMNFCGGEELGELDAAVALVGDDRAGLLGRPRGEARPPRSRTPPSPTSSASTPRSASVSVSTGFFLAAMIPLNDGYRGSLIFSTTLTPRGQRRLDRVVAVVGLPLPIAARGPSTSTLLANVSCGTPEPLGEHRRHDRHPRIGRLRAQDHQVPAELPERLGQHQRRGQRVRAVQARRRRRARPCRRPSAAPCGSSRSPCPGPCVRTVTGAASAPPCLLELQRLLDRVLVELVHDGVGRRRGPACCPPGSSFFSAQESGTCFTQTTMFIARSWSRATSHSWGALAPAG